MGTSTILENLPEWNEKKNIEWSEEWSKLQIMLFICDVIFFCKYTYAPNYSLTASSIISF